MQILKKCQRKNGNIYGDRQPVIAFTGDSVTQGCFELYVKPDGNAETVFNAMESYSQKVKELLAMLYPAANVTIVNAGISGNRAPVGFDRLQEDVLSFRPDLTVVCYGLNDSNQKAEGLEEYTTALRNIFRAVRRAGSEVIFMTPNMATDRVDPALTEAPIAAAAAHVSATVREGWLDTYVKAARQVCAEEQVPVCDCYALWQTMQAGGVDVTSLLSNKINHPTREMHWLFAYELVKTMFENP